MAQNPSFMSLGKDVKDRCGLGQRRKSLFLIAGVMALVLVMSGLGIPLAAWAASLNTDPAFTCGNKRWGIDNDLNNNLAHQFGKTTSCTGSTAWPAGTTTTNWVKLNVHNSNDDLAWQGAAQGDPLSPFPFGSEDVTPTTPSESFPASTANSYSLKVQWVWTNEVKPSASIPLDRMRVYMLTDVVLQHKTDPNKYIVVDFLTDALRNNNGNWEQLSISDQDSGTGAPYGNQYYPTFCKTSGSKTIYHYNAILDNTSTTASMWQDKTFSISSYFSQTQGMFGNHYNNDSGSPCPSGSFSDPGSRSDYEIRSLSSGAEVFRQTSTSYDASYRGGYSWSELFY